MRKHISKQRVKGKSLLYSDKGKDVKSHAAFGIWAGREEMKDVEGYVRRIRGRRISRRYARVI